MTPAYDLETTGLRLHALALYELRLLAEGDRDEASRSIGARLPETWPGSNLAAGLDVIQAEMSRLRPDHRWVWVIIDRDTSAVVGDVGFHGSPWESDTIEMGYFVVPESRGRGFATEASRALIAWTFASTGVTTIVLNISPENVISLRVAARLAVRSYKSARPGHLSFAVTRHSFLD